jgi:hypothetical protein
MGQLAHSTFTHERTRSTAGHARRDDIATVGLAPVEA